MTQAKGPPYRVIDMFDRLVVEFLPKPGKKSIQELLSDLISIVDELMANVINYKFNLLMNVFYPIVFVFFFTLLIGEKEI